jgi:ATP-binding cassette subfamily B protein
MIATVRALARDIKFEHSIFALPFAYLGMFYGPVQSLMTFSNWLTGFIAAGQRIYDVLDANVTVEEPEEPVALPRIDGAIEFRNVVFGYNPLPLG